MIWLTLALAAILGAWWAYRRRRAHHGVTPLWLLVNERREWTQGIDQSRITWPIRRDEHES